jgi:hypothetical protein
MNDRELEIQNEMKLKNEKDKQAIQSLKDKHMTEIEERSIVEKGLKDMATLKETQNKVLIYMYICIYIYVESFILFSCTFTVFMLFCRWAVLLYL